MNKSAFLRLLLIFLTLKLTAQNVEPGWYQKSDSLFQAGKYELALDKLREAASQFRQTDEASYIKATVKQGQILVKRKENEQALSLFDEVENQAQTGDTKVYIQLLTQKGFALANLRRMDDSRKYLIDAKKAIAADSLDHYMLSFIDTQLFTQALRGGRIDEASELVGEAVSHAEKSQKDDAQRNTFNKAAMFNWRMGNHELALDFLEREEIIVSRKFGSDSPEMANLLRNMAIVASSGEELEKAIFLVQRALDLIDKEKDSRIYFLSQSSLANYHNKLNEFEKGLSYADTALFVADKFKLDDSFLIETIVFRMTSLGMLKAFEELESAIDRLLQINESNQLSPFQEANVYRSVSTAYRRMGQNELSVSYLQKGIDIARSAFGTKNRYLNDLLTEMADTQRRMGSFDEALTTLGEVFENVSGDAYTDPTKFESINLAENFSTALLVKANILFQKSNAADLELLQETMKALELASEFVNAKRKRISGEYFGSSFRQRIKEQAIECLYAIHKLTDDEAYLIQALNYSELGRSEQLMVWLTEAEKFGDVGLSEEIYSTRRSLKQSIDMFEQMIGNLKESDSARQIQISDTLRILSKRYEEINLTIKNENDQFYSILYETPYFQSDQDIRDYSRPDETTVIFNESAGSWYVLIIGEDKKFLKIEGETPDISALRLALMDPDDQQFQEKSKELYQYFLAPVLPHVPGTKINFLTDKALAFIPMELLSNSNGKYLLESYNVRYSYMLRTPAEESTRSSLNLLAMAPDFSKERRSIDPIRSELSYLPGTDMEVNEVSALFKGTVLTGSEASEVNFRKSASDYGIVHLATHAIIDDDEPKNSRLVFQQNTSDSLGLEGYLHAYEIYNLDLNAQLVTLSACNTGFGKIRNGEGVMSLSRAFAYAGVPATVVSLWPASDKSTPELMKYFYQNLKEGQAKDEALNNARKEYLKNAVGKAKHPFYWGGFVLIGDNQPLEEDSNPLVWAMLALVVTLAVGMIIRRRKS